MTENKRFELDKHDCIYDNDSIAKDGGRETYWLIEYIQQKKLVEKMNKLADENKELKAKNEELKADNNRLVNETARIVAEHQGRVLDLIDKRIDKCEPIDYARNIEGDVPVFDCETATEIRVLNELKKELEDD